MKTLSIIFLSFYFLSTLTLTSQIIYVDAANNTGVEDGTEQHPFNMIKEGIAAAVAGNTVVIKAGNYHPDEYWFGNENALLLKAGVSLKGEGRDNTIIDGYLVDEQESNLSISLEDLCFLEFHFNRGPIEGPFNDQNIIRNCSAQLINQSFGAGIPVNDTTPGPNYGFLIEGNVLGTEGTIKFCQGEGASQLKVLNNSCGFISILSGGGYTYLIDNNDVQYGIADKSGCCITTISNNTIRNGGIVDKSGGNNYGTEDEIIENNSIASNEDSPFFEDEDLYSAISASSRSVTIRNNTITCTGHVSGIHASSGGPFHVSGNVITVEEILTPNPDPYEGIAGLHTSSGWGYIRDNTIYGGQIGYFSNSGAVEFSGNEIKNAYIGFYSAGNEEVHHNKIEDCYGDGMVLHGLRGPVHNNVIRNNAGSGIRVQLPLIDLGGGADTCPGNNVIMGNGDYDLFIECQSTQYPVLYARNNVWDHTNPADVALYDIHDGSDNTGLLNVDFTPVAYLGMAEQGSGEAAKQGEVVVFPNPVIGDLLNIRSETGISEVKVFSIIGQEVRNMTCPNEKEVKLDVSGLDNGIYEMKTILSDKVSFVSKIVICKL